MVGFYFIDQKGSINDEAMLSQDTNLLGLGRGGESLIKAHINHLLLLKMAKTNPFVNNRFLYSEFELTKYNKKRSTPRLYIVTLLI